MGSVLGVQLKSNFCIHSSNLVPAGASQSFPLGDEIWSLYKKKAVSDKYVFKVRNVEETFHDMAEAAMRQVVGDHSVTEVLTLGREEIQVNAKELLQDLCERYETGIHVEQLVMQDVNPPEPVKPSFNEVNQAIQEKERKINEAKAEYNRVIPEARGKAEQVLQEAEGYATRRG